MRHFFYTTTAAILFFQSLLFSSMETPLSLTQNSPTYIEVNNCLLAKVNGKPITMLDVVKKMDFFFERQFPQYAHVALARYEFYQIGWARFLQDLIDKELVTADAKACKLQVSAGDIRQEMENFFSGDITGQLEKSGMTRTEAWDLVKGDIQVRRMLYLRAQVKANQAVTPSRIRCAYEKFAYENTYPERWRYRILSFRSSEAKDSQESAAYAYNLLQQRKTLEEVAETLQAKPLVHTVTVNFSEEFCLPLTEISEPYRNALEKLTPGSYSTPDVQQSRSTKTCVYRIFYLSAIEPAGCASFAEVEARLKNELLEKGNEIETAAYLERLRSQFTVERYCEGDTFPAGYQPFVIR